MDRRAILRAAGSLLAAPAITLAPKAAEPAVASAEERARHHYAEFAKAMDELSAGVNGGWLIMAGMRRPYERLQGGSWASGNLIRYEMSRPDPRFRPMAVEWRDDLPFAPI